MSEKNGVVEKPKRAPRFEQTLVGKNVTIFGNDFKPRIAGKLHAVEQFNYILETTKFGRAAVLKHAVGVITETPEKAATADA